MRVWRSLFVFPFSTTIKTESSFVRPILANQGGKHPLTALADNTYQIGIWSSIEAGLGITAGSLATLRPLGRLLRERSSTSRNYYHSRGSLPLSRDLVNGHCSLPSKNKIDEDEYQLWGGSGLGNHHDVTTVALGNMTASSEEVFSPANTSSRSEPERSDLNLSLTQHPGTFGATLDSLNLQ